MGGGCSCDEGVKRSTGHYENCREITVSMVLSNVCGQVSYGDRLRSKACISSRAHIVRGWVVQDSCFRRRNTPEGGRNAFGCVGVGHDVRV